MAEFVEKYINPFTDYGFKKLFGEEVNKDLLLEYVIRNLNKLDRVPEKLQEETPRKTRSG